MIPEAGGQEVETVHIPDADRGALCISTQVGCSLTCSFCHTGTMPLVGNLDAGQILGQILIARDPGANTPQAVRNAFDARAQIDNITAIKPADLEITKEGNQMVIGFAYRKEVQLFNNVGLYFDFAANTAQP